MRRTLYWQSKRARLALLRFQWTLAEGLGLARLIGIKVSAHRRKF